MFSWFSDVADALWYSNEALYSLHQKVDALMASFAEAKQAWVDYATDLRSQLDAAKAALNDAQVNAQAAADALARFQADDAATDAQQLADQAQSFADELTAALDGLQNPPQEPEPLPEPPTTGEVTDPEPTE